VPFCTGGIPSIAYHRLPAFLSPAIPAALTKALFREASMTPEISPAIPPATSSSEQRWAAWMARGAARDRRLRRKLLIAVPILCVVAALGIIFLVGVRL
jgi:hypothetical protein